MVTFQSSLCQMFQYLRPKRVLRSEVQMRLFLGFSSIVILTLKFNVSKIRTEMDLGYQMVETLFDH